MVKDFIGRNQIKFFDEFSNSSPTVRKRVDEMPVDF